MRKFSLFAIVFFFLLTNSHSQPIPRTSDENLSKVDKLYYTCKIWGFLKYYHPLVSKGSYEWDEKIQKIISQTAGYQTHEAFSEYIARWIYYMGQIKPCNTCNQRNSNEVFLENFDLSWTQDRRFTEKFRSTFKNIEKNRFQGDHHYIEKGKIGEFIPKNEQQHFDLNWKDENQRLIPLFRFWNYVEYFYPYKYLTEQSWDDVLKEMISKFLEVNTKVEFHLAMLELVVKIDDSHAGLMTTVLEGMPYYNYLPARFDIIENQAVITEIIDAAKSRQADLQLGDVITKINGKPVMQVHNANKRYIWGSNEAIKDRSIYHTLFMGMQAPVDVTLERDGSTKMASLSLYKYSDISYSKASQKEKWTTYGDSIGYVNMGEISSGDVAPMMSELSDKTVIIFDVRNSPKGTYRAVSKYLNPSDTTFAIYTKPDFTYPGKFVWEGKAKCGSNNPDYFKGMIILLVDENTQSHAEFTCMSLQTAPNVVVVGSQTAGTNGKVSKFPIITSQYTAMSGTGVYYPNRSAVQRVGITPDVYVEQTMQGIKEKRDEILEKAIEISKEKIAEEIAEAKAALEKALMDSMMRLDSLRLDSLQMNAIPIDTLRLDTLRIDTLKVDNIEKDQ
ncbi:S41 family peptidase [Ekhidna sp.]